MESILYYILFAKEIISYTKMMRNIVMFNLFIRFKMPTLELQVNYFREICMAYENTS